MRPPRKARRRRRIMKMRRGGATPRAGMQRRPTGKLAPRRGTLELRALDVVAEHLAHGVSDLAFGRVGAGAVEDLLHQVRLTGRGSSGGGERAERRRARLVVAGPAQLG